MSTTIAARGPATRRALLAGASLSALAVSPAGAAAVRGLSPAWFAARVDASTAAAAAAGTAASTLSQVTAANRNLATLATRLAQMQSVQAAAATAAATAASSVPNGLVPGGLEIAPGAVPGGPSWQGADLPTQMSIGNRVAVAVKQTAPQAMLTWQTFNIGRKTDLSFNQTAGGAGASGWVVLNRVEDPAAAPSTILGTITAPGRVYVINANGIVFGAGSQVSLGALIASTAAISDTQFASGIYGAQNGASFDASFTGAASNSTVLVEQGAQITTAPPASVTAGGGSVMLLGGMVENDGIITTPQGQTVLAAGQDFILRTGYSTTGNQAATVLGNQIQSSGTLGTALNTGLISAPLGDITLAAHAVTQAGLALSTTSTAVRGTIHLQNAVHDATGKVDTTGSITLGANSVTSVDPDNSATTALDSQRASLVAQSALNDGVRHSPTTVLNPQLDDISTLPDQLDASRIEITTGGTVDFAAASLTLSQGGQIAVSAGQRAWVGDGAALDVSGSTAAVLPMSSNTISVNIQGNELRDAPVNRDTGALNSNTVTLDTGSLLVVPASAADPLARDYTQGGLLEVSGYLADTGHTIDEWAALGGTITLSAKTVISQPAAELNVSGGAVNVQAGSIPQSYLIGADGTLYNVNTAPGNIAYTGVYDGFSVDHPRWGITQTYDSSILAPSALYRAGYYYGRDAGQVIVSAPTAVLEAPIIADVTNGSLQTGARPHGLTDPYTYSSNTIALPGTLAVGGYATDGSLLAPHVTISDLYGPVADTIAVNTPVPAALVHTVGLSANQLNSEGLGGLSVVTATDITLNSPLVLAPGGTLTLQGATVRITANLTARGGAITVADVTTDPYTGVVVPLPAGSGGDITIGNQATVDLRGQWTNAVLDPVHVAGAGLVNGGSLTVDSLHALHIDPKVVIDASSGAAVLAGGKQRGGAGGNVSLIGDDPFYGVNTAPVLINPILRDYGVAGGGTLTIGAPDILIAATPSPVDPQTVLLAPGTFKTGFSDYVINGASGLTIAPQTQITVAEPVYSFNTGFDGSTNRPLGAPTGEDPAAVLPLILPSVYTADAANARLTQRRGASVSFISNDRPGLQDFGGGSIDVGAGSAINVDPGQSVRIEAFAQITDDGAITARGGSVAIVNTKSDELTNSTQPAYNISIWIGGDAVIDTSGLATTANDGAGRYFGVVSAGGRITIGSDGGIDAAKNQISTDAPILVRPGALLNASGAAATIDLLAGTAPYLNTISTTMLSEPVLDTSNGGAISFSSFNGIDLQGTLRAAAGGPGAAGGSLSMVLETPLFPLGAVVANALRQPRIITLTQTTSPSPVSPTLMPGEQLPLLLDGAASLSQQQIADGGFDAVSLYARDAFVFGGNVALATAGSITLQQGIVSDSSNAGVVSLSAPYVQLDGQVPVTTSSPVFSINYTNWAPYSRSSSATFTVNASLIDLRDNLRFGVSDSYALLPVPVSGNTTAQVDLPGFGQIALNSSGDIRFATGTFTTPGNLTLNAADIYPITGAVAKVYAGYNQYLVNRKNVFLPTGTITVQGNGANTGIPFSVGGSLALYAGAIVQDGVIRAPEGTIALGGIGVFPPGDLSGLQFGFYTYTVDLRPGSVTSVSLDGLTVPYGGTVDGVTYTFNGAPVSGSFTPAVSLSSQVQTVDAGALLDMSGGGTLAGAGFIGGRGGSTDVLNTPLLQFSAGSVTAPTLAADPVYAILPGYSSLYAPLGPVQPTAATGAVPAVGGQIAIGAGVPGVAPGTYTLLPSYYALLPGGARVQINTGTIDQLQGVTTVGAESYALNATTATANSGVFTSVPTEVIVTPAAGVLAASQYDQQTYTSFALAQSALFGTPRVTVPEDGKTLNLLYPDAAATVTALNFAGTSLFAGTTGFFNGQASVNATNLEVTPDFAVPTAGFTSVAASALDAFGAPRLSIGGVPQRSSSIPNELDFVSMLADSSIVVRMGAVLRAPELFLVAASAPNAQGSIMVEGGALQNGTLQGGAVLDTVGQGAPPFDSSAGYFYNSNGNSVVALSNGSLIFEPTGAADASTPITIAAGAALYTQGTLAFVTKQNLSLDQAALFGARDLSIAVNTINIASDASLAASTAGTLALPAGFTLTQSTLGTLLAGTPLAGTPPLQSLTLTAAGSINFAGTAGLNTIDPVTGLSTLQVLSLNTPAIYGAGTATDVASITTGTLYLNGVPAGTPVANGSVPGSALPSGVVANGPGFGTGMLDITAQNIVLGYGPNTRPDDQTTLDRLIEGFATVTLSASNSVSANSRGTLSVYQMPAATYGAAGTGGTLNIVTPLLTGAAASVDAITAGGALTIAPPSGLASTATTGALGAQLDLTALSIADTSTVLLNSGRLTMTAADNLTLGAGARIDLTGQAVPLLDQTRYSSGGTVVLTAQTGSIATDPSSLIDVSATGAAAGSVQADAIAGLADLAGAITGTGAPGTTGGAFAVHAATLADFDGLNDRLTAGGLFASRAFELGTGDLTVDQTVQAQAVNIATDTGALTVTGTIDASSTVPGAITLAAGGDLTLATGALLDAHATTLLTDSTGAAIEAENRASVTLTTSAGTLDLGAATIDLRALTPAPLGQLTLIAPRLLTGGAETGDVAINAPQPVTILGAQTVALYGSRTYTPTDADGTIEQHADPLIPGAVSLDQLNADNTAFITASAASGLAARTPGLGAYQLRPADTIQSSAATGGNLVVNGDLDLSGLRYGPGVIPGVAGSGDVGLLTLRAANTLSVNGSITDGFAAPADAVTTTRDDKGWVLYSNEPLGQPVTLPMDLSQPILLSSGTSFSTQSQVALNYSITIAGATLNAGVVIPTAVVTAKAYKIGAGGLTTTAAIADPTGAILFAPGQILPAGTVIPSGSTLGLGSVLPFAVKLASGTVWPAGAQLSLFAGLSVRLSLPPGGTLSLAGGAYIPAGSSLVLPRNATSMAVRAQNAAGEQGLIYAIAPLLPAGSDSWSINLVGGANLAAADLLAVQPATALAAAEPGTPGPQGDPAGSVVLADTHYTLAVTYAPTASFSVVRTGTGALNVVAGGNVDEASLFGVYTAGTQTSLGTVQDAAFQTGRAAQSKTSVLGRSYDKTYGTVIAGQLAYYPDHGGNVLVAAQNSVLGDIVGLANAGIAVGTDSNGNWLWRQGGDGIGQSTSWWINFGSYVLPLQASGSAIAFQPVLAGFTGIGALGGGNVTVEAGGDAGEVDAIQAAFSPISQGLVIAVASTGRVTSVAGSPGAITGGTAVLTGGGALSLQVAGTLNPAYQPLVQGTLGGTLTDMRGDISVAAGQVGRIDLQYGVGTNDPRPQSPFSAPDASATNGLAVAPGDGSVSIQAMRDVVLAGAGDPGRIAQQALTAIAVQYIPVSSHTAFAGNTGFSLWTDATAIDLFSAGGNITPITALLDRPLYGVANDAATDYRFVYPATLDAVAASGSVYYGTQNTAPTALSGDSLELAPSPIGQLSLLAAQSIYGHGFAVDMSGAATGLNNVPNPYNPAFTDDGASLGATGVISNFLISAGNNGSPLALFGFEADTPTTDLHQGDPQPARVYAATGDLVDVQIGEVLNFPLASNETPGTWYLAAKPTWVMAGRDIVSSGTRPFEIATGLSPAASTTYVNQRPTASSAISSGNLLLNLAPTDVSVFSAGRDILGSYVYVAGPGLLEVDAGRNIDETGDAGLAFGVLKSVGQIINVDPASRNQGAGIAVTTGAGSLGPDYTAFSSLYLNDANQANLALPLTDPANTGKVQQTYQQALYAWLQTTYGYTGTEADAPAYFATLPTTAADVFDRSVFFDELVASGRQYSDPASLFFKSYDRGRTAIATLFPTTDAAGNPIAYDGNLTMDSGSFALPNNGGATNLDAGISTLAGGSIQVLSPGGQDVFGTAGGPVPGASSGVITDGSGDIDIYALNSVLLGQSRIFTTFGGNIAIWSAQGDINAGRGSKTTTVFQPPLIAYDPYGGITLAPAAPTSGAGIATLAPIPGTTPGNVDLIAPLGTVDAGEAGIRVSGNLNIAAFFVLNAANVQVGGKTTGSTAVVATNTAAAVAAASAAGSAVQAATTTTPTHTAAAALLPSIITVEILNDDTRRRRPAA